jgi:hypothetical protein
MSVVELGISERDVSYPKPLKTISKKIKQQKEKIDTGETLEYVPIFKAGNWQGMDFTIDDLQEIVDNTNALIKANIHEPPLKLGHNDNQKFVDGLPAIGWVAGLKLIGDQIFANFVNVPKKVVDAIRRRNYSKISSEIYLEFIHPNTQKNIGKVLRAVALLGADIPEVKGLGDIEKLYSENRFEKKIIMFSEQNFKEVDDMKELWTEQDIKKWLPCCYEKIVLYMKEKGKKELTTKEVMRFIEEKKIKFKDEAEQIECPPGFKWDEKLQRCIKTETSTKDEAVPEEQKVCPKGYKWDEAQQKCVKVEEKSEEDKDKEKEKQTKDEDKKKSDIKEQQEGDEDEDEDKDENIDEEGSDDEIGLRDILADAVFEKSYDDLSDEEKEKIHNIAAKVRKRFIRQRFIRRPTELQEDKIKEPDKWDDEFKKKIVDEFEKLPDEQKNVDIEFPEDLRPPKEWWDRCISSVSDVTDTPERLCGWVYYNWMTPETKREVDALKTSEKEDEKVLKLKEKLKKLENEKYQKRFEELIQQNRKVLLPKFDNKLNLIFNELQKTKNIIVFKEKQDNKEVEVKKDIRDLFIELLEGIAKEKIVIFGELLKTGENKEKINIKNFIETDEFEQYKKQILEKYENKPVKDIEISFLAQKIQQENKNLSFREAVKMASQLLENSK